MMLVMKIYMDDQLQDLDAATVGGAIDEVSDIAARNGRMVVELTINGENMSGEMLEAILDRIGVDGDELRMVTADPCELAVDVLGQIRGTISEIMGLQQEAADLLQQDDTSAAFEKLGQLISNWLNVQQAISQSTSLVGLKLDDIEVEGSPVSDLTNELLEQLRTLKELIEGKDMITLADVLEYEWPEVSEKWDKLAANLSEKMKLKLA